MFMICEAVSTIITPIIGITARLFSEICVKNSMVSDVCKARSRRPVLAAPAVAEAVAVAIAVVVAQWKTFSKNRWRAF